MANAQIFARLAHRNGATRLIEHRQNAPLKIARTFPDETGGLEICVMDASPGLLAGDTYETEWVIEAGARARITNQGATRVHPRKTVSIDSSRQMTRARVATDACLTLWPSAIIPFRRADFRSETEVFLAKGAHFSFFECLSAGRVARGEKFEFDRVQIKTRVCDARGPLFYSRNIFVPSLSILGNPFCFGSATQWANYIVFGSKVSKNAAAIAQQVLDKHKIHGAASELSRGGIAVMMLGHRAHDLNRAASEIDSKW